MFFNVDLFKVSWLIYVGDGGMEDFVENQSFQLWKRLQMVVGGSERVYLRSLSAEMSLSPKKLHFFECRVSEIAVFRKINQNDFRH